jgi:hypothetical protein
MSNPNQILATGDARISATIATAIVSKKTAPRIGIALVLIGRCHHFVGRLMLYYFAKSNISGNDFSQ